MFPALSAWFPRLTRDDAKWVWAQVLGLAALVAANVTNLPTWFAYYGVMVTDIDVHRLSLVAIAALYLGGRYGTSPLPGAPK